MLVNRRKPKHSRASAPKVRTGCLTCKTRHLKCGEEKPTCARCKNDGFHCDGYLQSVVATTITRKKPKKVFVPWLPTPIDTIRQGSDSERRFLHHVQQSTIKDLAFSSNRLEFWNRLVLAPAHSSEAVRHALVALGAAHWLFITGPSTPSTLEEITKLQNLVLAQYNQAIQHLTSQMTESKTTDFHLTLVCCLVFFALENLMGRYAESLQHLRAASRLLASPDGYPASRQDSPGPFASDDAICEMAEMFSTLGVQASLFLDEPVVDDLSFYYRLKAGHKEETDEPFSDLADARSHLCAIEVEFNNKLEHSKDDIDSPVLEAIFDKFRRWVARFDRSNIKPGNMDCTFIEQREYLALKLSRRLWLAAFDSESTEDDNDAYTEVLDLAEVLVLSNAKNTHPVFTLHADVVPALNFVCDASENVGIQQRAIKLLRSMKRREGLWDSQDVAEYLQDSITARKMLMHGWDDVLGGLPGAARALSSMNLSTLSPTNGILLMAKKTQMWAQD